MELAVLPNGNYRIAMPYQDAASTKKIIYVADYNFTTGDVIPGTGIPLDLPIGSEVHGLEFSKDGQFLYVTHTGLPYMQFVDLNTSTAFTALQNVLNNPANLTPSEFQYSQIEMDNNGFMLFGRINDISGINIGFTNTPVGANWTQGVILTGVPSSLSLYTNGYLSNDIVTTRSLNDQIDGEVYQNFSSMSPPSNCCIFNSTFTAEKYTAGTSLPVTPITFNYSSFTQAWTPGNNPFGGTSANPVSLVTIRNQLIIPAGYNITITGMTFQFAPRTYPSNIATPGASVEVRRSPSSSSGTGGRLTLSNTTFTSYDGCGLGMWEGVEVHGYSTIAQGTFANSQMGWFRMLNSSVISNAWRGVITADVTDPLPTLIPTVIVNSSGGVVQGASSTFSNNRVSTMFLAYNVPLAAIDNNASYFDRCVFTTTAALNDINAVAPFAQAVLWDTKGILFRGNTFSTDINTSPYALAVNNTGMGIWAIRSAFKVLPFPITLNINQRSVFTNLNYGVAVSNSGSTKTVTVDQSDFKNTYRGVFLNVVNIATVTRNNFQVYRSLVSNNPGYGLYLNYSRGFQVEQNDFSYSGATSPMAFDYGIVVNQSNPARSCGLYDEIYRNTFHSINYGIQVYGNNSEQPGCANANAPNNTGLVLKCNKFYSNEDSYDIRVADFIFFNTTVRGNIAYQQGNCSLGNTAPANNQYSYTHNFPTSDYAIDGTFTSLNPNAIAYTWSSASMTLPLVPTFYTTPVPYSGVNLSGCSAYTYSDANSCPASSNLIPFPANASSQKQAIADEQQQIDAMNTTLTNGDAASLYAIISSGSPGQVQNALLAQSPYLSDGVLLAAIQRNLPAGTLKNIIVANCPVSADVMAALNAISLPNGIRNQINAAQTGVSERTQLVNLLSAHQALKGKFVNDLLRIYLNDSTLEHGVDSVLLTYQTYKTPEYRCEMVKGYLDKKDTTAAKVMIDTLRTLGGEDNFCLLAEVLIKLDRVGQSCFGIASDPSLASDVMAVAADGSKRVCADANSLLQLVFQYQFNEYFDNPNNQSARFGNNPYNEATSPMAFRIYPNPSSGLVQLDYSLGENETGVLQIFNSTGSLVTSQMLTKESNRLMLETDLSQGVYLCMVSVNGEMKFTERLIIVR